MPAPAARYPSLVFRGQTSQHLLPARTALVSAGICPYANLRDHSLIPSLYRGYDRFMATPQDFHSLIVRLLDWKLMADLTFGDPADYRSPDGDSYQPKEIPQDATVKMEFFFDGDAGQKRGFEDLRPRTEWIITLPDGTVWDRYTKLLRPGQDSVRQNLVLQHYGAPTPFVDVTRDIRVAEWFALDRLHVDAHGVLTAERATGRSHAPVIYVLFSLEDLTPLVDTAELVTAEESLRPHRQSCALIGGPGNLYRNAVSRFVGLKIEFADSFVPRTMPTTRHLFPGPDEDNTLKHILAREELLGSGERPFPVYWYSTGN